MDAPPSQPRVSIWPLNPDAPLRIHMREPAPPPADQQADIERAWQQLCTANPRLFDGPMLSLIAVDPDTNTLTCRHEQYKHLAVAHAVPIEIHQLGVTGVVLGRDTHSTQYVLLGKRSTHTRTYPAMWELAPAGGIDPPLPLSSSLPTPATLDEHFVFNALRTEANEELGMDIQQDWVRFVAIARDEQARNDDLIGVITLPDPIDSANPPGSADQWEYEAVRWVALADVPAFDAQHAAHTIPPTRTLFRYFKWITDRLPEATPAS